MGTAQTDSRQGCTDIVVFAIGLTDQPGNGLEAAAQETVYGRFSAILTAFKTVLLNKEAGAGLKRNQASIVEANLRSTAHIGDQGIAFVDGRPPLQASHIALKIFGRHPADSRKHQPNRLASILRRYRQGKECKGSKGEARRYQFCASHLHVQSSSD